MKLLSLLNITALLALSVNAATLNKRQSACATKLEDVKTAMDTLFTEVQAINIINAPLLGFKIPQAIAAATNRGYAYVSACGQNYVYSEEDKADILPVFVALGDSTIKALNLVIGKKALPTLFPFYEPIRVTLIQYESTYDTLTFSLAAVPEFTSVVTPKAAEVSVKISAAIDTYTQDVQPN